MPPVAAPAWNCPFGVRQVVLCGIGTGNHPSPANLFALDLQKDSDAKIEICVYYEYQSGGGAVRFGVHLRISLLLMAYSTQKHPLVADLQALISYCTPDRATDENGMLLEEEKKEIHGH